MIILVLLLMPLSAFAQQEQPAGPAPDMSGLPVWVHAIPKPASEPWRMPTGEERLALYARQTFGVAPLMGAGMGALITFSAGRPEEWPRHFRGYSHRFANNAAQHYIRSTAIHGIAALLREDNTYYRSRKEGVGARIGYAVSHTFLARNSAGELRFSASRFAGGVGASKLSRTWLPPSWKGWDNTMISYGLWSASEASMNILREFYPDIVRGLRGRRNKP